MLGFWAEQNNIHDIGNFRPNIGGVRAGRIANVEQDTFMKSLSSAKDARGGKSTQQENVNLAEDFVSRREYQAVSAQLNDARETISALRNELQNIRSEFRATETGTKVRFRP